MKNLHHTTGRLTCDAAITRTYLVNGSVTFSSGNNHVCEFIIYTQDGYIVSSKSKSTTSAAGRSENISLLGVTTMNTSDFVEIHCRNTSAAVNITGIDLNVIINQFI